MRLRKAWLRYLVYALLGLALLAAGAVWLVRGETGLGWVAGWAQGASGGHLRLEAVQGRLVGPIRVGVLTWETETRRIRVSNLFLDWRPRELAQHRRLEVTRLAADEVLVEEIRPDPEPAKPPETLALPVALSLPQVTVTRLTVVKGGKRLAFQDLELALDKPAHTYRLALTHLASPWGRLAGRLELADQTPYALHAQAELEQPDQYRVAAQAGGELGRIRVQAKADQPLILEAQALVTPFAPLPLESAQARAESVNPRQFQAAWPIADLNLTADFKLLPDGRISGELVAKNRQPGPVDKERLPLVGLTGRFTGDQTDLALADLRLDLGPGGGLEGDGHWRGERLSLDLTTANLNPAALHSRLRPLRLAGGFELVASRDEQTLLARLRHDAYALDLDLGLKDLLLRVAAARLAAPQGELSAQGQVGLAGNQAFDLNGRMQHFNPASFGDFPAADLNARLTAKGQLTPKPRGSLEFRFDPSQLRGQPLAGQGRLVLEVDRLADSRVNLDLAENHLRLQGAFGRPGDKLAWQVDATRLDRFDARLRGQLTGEGSLSGTLAAPDVQLQASARDLAWAGDWVLARLEAKGRLEQGLDGPLEIDAQLSGLRGQGVRLDTASLKGGGTRSSHRLQASARGRMDANEGGDKGASLVDARAVLAGGWRDGQWSGQVRELENKGRHALFLHAPADLTLAPEHVNIARMALDYAGARLTLASLDWSPDRLASKGSVTGLRVARAMQLWSIPRNLWRGGIRLGGDWDLSLGATANGRASLWREAGDVTITTDPAVALELDNLRLDLAARDNALSADLAASGATLGILEVRAQSRLSRSDGVWGLAGNAPLGGEVVFGLPSLAWLAPFIDRSGNLVLAGAASARLDLGGTLASPRLGGDLAGEDMRLDWPAVGLKFKDGSIAAHLENDRLDLSRFQVMAGEGLLSAQGTAALRGDQAALDLTWRADKLQALSRPDRQLTVSGKGRVAVTGRQVELRGDLRADQALLELPKAETLTRSDDVVVLGRQGSVAQSTPLTVALDLGLDLGDNFILKGRGLDAQLAGKLRVRAAPRSQPRVTGTVKVAKGSYSAYGQRLTIERGVVDFQGLLDNPGLDILAMRRNQDVAAGVALTGTALAPRAQLVSEPEVPDTEKLSWLVLGRGTETASSVDLNLLTAAASALLAAGDSVSLQARIARQTGLDEVGLKGSGELENTVLTLGKRLSAKAYLTYEQGLTGVGNLVKLNYTLSRRWSVQAQTGRETAVDLFYTLGFD